MANEKVKAKARIPYMRYAACVKRYASKIATTHYSRYDSLHTVSVYGMWHAVCGMLQIESLHVAIDAASEGRQLTMPFQKIPFTLFINTVAQVSLL